ncbi:MAG: metallophosphoesterase [Lachnospiraceae bacterium]|nr:metallophosphoesterase [Lachnospiraceae bacterium]
MIAVYLSPLYLLLCAYVFYRLQTWLERCLPYLGKKRIRIPVAAAYTLVAFSILAAFLLEPTPAKRLLKQFSNTWLGVLLYALLVIGLADLLRLVLKRLSFRGKGRLFSRGGHMAAGAVCILCVCGLSAAGIVSADQIRVTDYELYVDKEAAGFRELKIVLVADLHLGYSIGVRHMEQMVRLINEQEPDLVVMAGDIFDNEYEALEDSEALARVLGGIQSQYGVYACYGNHDIREKVLAGFTFSGSGEKASDPRMDAFLEEAGIRLLREEGVLIRDAFYLYGRPDYGRPGRGIRERRSPGEITAGMDLSKPVIVIDHQPRELQELADAGVDIDLCGHTHDGQTFPGNLTARLFWENICGYLQKDSMHNIVTSGVGVFGPDMRLGTRSEICVITVGFR